MSLATVEAMPTHRRKTPLRTLQVEDPVWDRLGKSALTAGSTRPDFLRECMDWVNADPELWAEVRRAAEERGETMRAAVLRGLARYLDGPNP